MPPILGILGLLWNILRTTVTNPSVNKAMDNWTNGTSNHVDDMVWDLIQILAGVPDPVERERLLDSGLREIEVKYQIAKREGRLSVMKEPTKKWNPPSYEDVRKMMDPDWRPISLDDMG